MRVSVGELSLVLANPVTDVTVALPLLPVCVASPPYEAVTVFEPSTDGVYVTEQRPLASTEQVVPRGKSPLALVKVTVPVGVVAPAPAASVTVAVQVVARFTTTVAGVQVRLVLVDLFVVVTVAVPPLTA